MNIIFNNRFLLTTITLNNFEKDPIYEKNDNMGAAFKTAYTSYIMGFFSGVNVVYEHDTGLAVFEELYSEIFANCKAAPDASFIAAIINLYAELKK